MSESKVKILNDEGMHARPAAAFVKEANNFQSEIQIDHNGNSTNAKSIMGIMALGLVKDADITIKAEGPDADVAVNKLTELVNNRFELN